MKKPSIAIVVILLLAGISTIAVGIFTQTNVTRTYNQVISLQWINDASQQSVFLDPHPIILKPNGEVKLEYSSTSGNPTWMSMGLLDSNTNNTVQVVNPRPNVYANIEQCPITYQDTLNVDVSLYAVVGYTTNSFSNPPEEQGATTLTITNPEPQWNYVIVGAVLLVVSIAVLGVARFGKQRA